LITAVVGILVSAIVTLIVGVAGVLAGAIITFVVSQYCYRRAASDLRWEARAGPIPSDIVELLVAYRQWGDQLRPRQAIQLGKGMRASGLTWYYRRAYAQLTRYSLGHLAITFRDNVKSCV